MNNVLELAHVPGPRMLLALLDEPCRSVPVTAVVPVELADEVLDEQCYVLDPFGIRHTAAIALSRSIMPC
jgi:hypothetical protein